MSASRSRGALCLVLHTHMPYVEGFGTWPFGEEWLWEAVASVYLPLLGTLEGTPLTLTLTPVLCDQLETLSGQAGERLGSYVREVKREVHARDAAELERLGEAELAAEVRRAAGDYTAADAELERVGGDLLAGFRRLAASGLELWTSASTHAVLPLVATRAGLRLQLDVGVRSFARRFGAFGGGFWLPECAYEPGLEHDLAEHRVRAFCVDQTEALGLGAPEQLEPVATEAGPVAVPIDWQTVALVWGGRGYPASPDYRDYWARTRHDLRAWSNAGEPYDHGRAVAVAREQARDFVERALARLDAYAAERGGRPGVLCCALDTELLGHWWYEGQEWLCAVLREAPARGLELATVSQALELVQPVERALAASTWGEGKDLATWDSPQVADLALAARRAELELVTAGPRLARGRLSRAARELLALQSSDWTFQASRELAGDYPRERVRGHLAALESALQDSATAPEPGLRNLAPELDTSPLLVP